MRELHAPEVELSYRHIMKLVSPRMLISEKRAWQAIEFTSFIENLGLDEQVNDYRKTGNTLQNPEGITQTITWNQRNRLEINVV